MFSIFLCASWPSASFLWRDVYLGLLPTFFFFFWLIYFLNILSSINYLYILEMNPLCIALFANIFSHSESCQPLRRTVWMFLKKLKIEQPHYWDTRFLSSFSSLPSTPSLPSPLLPVHPSLFDCVRASEAVLASLDLCGSGWEDSAAIRAAVCSALIELLGLEGFFAELSFPVDMVSVICHKIIPSKLFTGLNA